MYRFTHTYKYGHTFETQHHPLIRELTLSKRIHAVSLCDVRTRYTHMGTPPQLTTTWSRAEPGKLGHALCSFRAHKVRGQGANGC